MAKIYKMTDRLEIKIDDITIKVAPLNHQQKSEIQRKLLEGQKANDIVTVNESLILAVRYSLKSIKGVQTEDGQEYQLEFDGGLVTEECVNDLMNMEHSQALLNVCATLISGVPKKFNLEGVSFVEQGKKP